jgi:target of rapamycin complex 2 subunit MAPKAP1
VYYLSTISLLILHSFLIHNLRLSYLREVEDPYGPRLISLDPSYTSNPYVVAASLADPDRWPELAAPSSPQISEDEGERPSGFPGARLKYTQTITGNKVGGFGIRVNGKRISTSKRMSSFVRQADRQAPLRERSSALSTTAPVANVLPSTNADGIQEESNKEGEDTAPRTTSVSQPNVQVQASTAVEDMPVAKAVQFVPRFAGAAEMEARRRVRMAARRMPGSGTQPPPPKPAFSSSEEDGDVSDDSSDDFGVSDQVSNIDETDEFDP